MIRRIADAAQAARQKAMEAAREAARKAAEAARQKAAEAARKAAEAARARDAFEAKPKQPKVEINAQAKAEAKPVQQAKPAEVKKDLVADNVKEQLESGPRVNRHNEVKTDVKTSLGIDGDKLKVGVQADHTNKTHFTPVRPEAAAAESGEKAEKSKLNTALGVAAGAGTLLGAAGLQKQHEGASWDTTGKDQLQGDKVSFAGGLAGTKGSSNLSIGADGVKGAFNREATAGLYAQKNDRVDGQYGSAAYQAGAQLEAKASVDGKAQLDANGLDASLDARAGVSAAANIAGQVETRPISVSGVDLTAGASGNLKVEAKAEAYAKGQVQVTRDPPTAIATGEVGASAVAKAEAEVKLEAGPFAVKANAYASAGAEAQASGVIGFQDGKLQLGGQVGAALGVGAGAGATVEVDVAMIGQMAKNAADRDGDGKLGLGDVKAGAQQLGQAAVGALDRDGDGKLGLGDVKAGAQQVVNGAKDAVTQVGEKVTEKANQVKDTVVEAASQVVDGAVSTVKDAGKKVAGWFGF